MPIAAFVLVSTMTASGTDRPACDHARARCRRRAGATGETSRGFWEFLSVDEPRAFEVTDGFLGEDGKQAPDMPTMRMRFTFEPHDGGTRMVTVTTCPSLEALEQLLEMGMEKAMKAAMAQIDGVLAEQI